MTRGEVARKAGVALLTVGLLAGGTAGLSAPAEAQFAAADNMNPMDHGPFVSSTITLDPMSPRGIVACKGIAVKVGPDATMVFDTDLLRVVGAWTGGLLHWLPPAGRGGPVERHRSELRPRRDQRQSGGEADDPL